MSLQTDLMTLFQLTTPCTAGTKHFLTATCNANGDDYIFGSETEVGGGGGTGLAAKSSKCGGCTYADVIKQAIMSGWKIDDVFKLIAKLKE